MKLRSIVLGIILLNLSYSNADNNKTIKNKVMDKLYEDRNKETLLNGMINHLIFLNKVNCLTVICDSNYLNLFKGQWFRRINSIPIIMIVVDEPEDLLSPNFRTLESIRQSRKDGCKLYIIFIANGIQASRFLVFGDRYRLIDTRANFIMHYDLRLFAPKLHYIWKRIINIVFIREHQNAKSKFRNSTSWYELSTVPFPHPIKDVLVPKRILSWKTNTLFKPPMLFPDKTLDLKGHAINAVAFQHVPAIVKAQRSSNKNKLFSGMEMEIIETIASMMNFETKVYEPSNANVEKWGRLQLNGSYTGLLGEMVRGKADVALGNLHYTPYNLQLTDLSIPYIAECLTFLTPESLSDNSWKTLILPFKLYMWVAVLLVLMVSGIIFYLLANFHKRIEKNHPVNANPKDEKTELGQNVMKINLSDNIRKKKPPTGLYLFEEFINSVLYTYSMLLVVSLPRLPTGWSIRLLTGWYWLYCVLVVTSYRASMTAILANPVPRVTIDTMNQLADGSISCGGWGSQSKEFFTTSLDETSQKIGKKFESISNPVKSIQRIIKGELAYYDNAYFLQYLMARQELSNKQNKENNSDNMNNKTQVEEEDETPGDRNLHIMRECAIHMPISIGLQKNSPLKLRIDKLLRKLIEAGLIEKWLNDVMVPIRSAITMDKEIIKAEINLKKLYAGFVALGIGYGISICILIAEILHWRYIVLRDPKFDIYARYNYFKNK